MRILQEYLQEKDAFLCWLKKEPPAERIGQRFFVLLSSLDAQRTGILLTRA